MENINQLLAKRIQEMLTSDDASFMNFGTLSDMCSEELAKRMDGIQKKESTRLKKKSKNSLDWTVLAEPRENSPLDWTLN